jgi:hypothetical protein
MDTKYRVTLIRVPVMGRGLVEAARVYRDGREIAQAVDYGHFVCMSMIDERGRGWAHSSEPCTLSEWVQRWEVTQ